MEAVIGEGAPRSVVCVRENGAEFGAAAEEASSLAIRKIGGFGLGEVDAIEAGKLKELALDHVLREADENIEDGEVAFLQGDLEGLHVEPVAGEDAHVIAPAGIGGGAAAAGVRAVDDVVMDESGAVNHFDDGAERYGAAALIAAGSGGKEQKRGAKALAAAFAKVAADFGNGLNSLARLDGDFALDERKVVTDEVKNLAYGQNGDDNLHGNCETSAPLCQAEETTEVFRGSQGNLFRG